MLLQPCNAMTRQVRSAAQTWGKQKEGSPVIRFSLRWLLPLLKLLPLKCKNDSGTFAERSATALLAATANATAQWSREAPLAAAADATMDEDLKRIKRQPSNSAEFAAVRMVVLLLLTQVLSCSTKCTRYVPFNTHRRPPTPANAPAATASVAGAPCKPAAARTAAARPIHRQADKMAPKPGISRNTPEAWR